MPSILTAILSSSLHKKVKCMYKRRLLGGLGEDSRIQWSLSTRDKLSLCPL